MFKHQCEAHRTRSAVEVQHGSSPQAFNAKLAGPDQPLRFSMVFRFRPYHPQRFIHQKLHPNPTRIFKHQCEAHRTRSAVEVQHGSSPSGHITRSASSIRSFTQIRQKCASLFKAKPTGPDQLLRFSMALPPQAISPAALHPSEASPKSDKNVQASMRSPPDQISR